MPGYVLDDENLKRLNRKYLCTRCENVLRDPIQTECGHLYCKTCIWCIADQGGPSSVCVIDGKSLGKTFEDNFFKREILDTNVLCTNHQNGCSWTGELRLLEKHQDTCPWMTIECNQNGCNAKVIRQELEAHRNTSCSQRLVSCQYCEGSLVFINLEIHKQTCPKLPVECEKCGKTDIAREELTKHLDPKYGDCEKVEGVCPFKDIGCAHQKKMKKKERQSHIASNNASHLILLLGFVEHVFETAKSVQQEVQECRPDESLFSLLKKKVSTCFTKIENIVKENVDLRKNVTQNHERITKLETKNNSQELFGGDLEPDCQLSREPQASQSSNCAETTRRLNDLDSKFANLELLLIETNRSLEEQRVKNGVVQRQMELAEEKILRLERRIETQDHMLALRNIALADLEEKVKQQEVSGYDGTLLWKITDFSARRNNALMGRETSFYSPCFYTSRHGYKMAARIYLNGDGMGKATHISLFFVVMRGDYDALLRWPFRQKVTMMILDQNNVEHVIDAFKPDPSSSSFQRPKRNMNIASGSPLFFPLTDLEKHAYVKDDTMFVKFCVDTSDII